MFKRKKTQGQVLRELLESFVHDFQFPPSRDLDLLDYLRDAFSPLPIELRAYLFASLLLETMKGWEQ